MPIRVLPPNLVDQIAAGEVIERPASVVKELYENALDAGARRIEIDIEGAGLGLIRVRDDGCGLIAGQGDCRWRSNVMRPVRSPPWRILRRAIVELWLPWRGVALDRIGVAPADGLASRRNSAEAAAAELSVEGGVGSNGLKPAAHPIGTSVEVRDLFYNVPARRKFVRSASTEFGHILRQVERLALGGSGVGVRLRHNGREILHLPGGDQAQAAEQRLDRILGGEFRAHAMRIERQAGPMKLSGWLGLPTAARAQPDMQFWFVNGRAVRDRLLGNAGPLGVPRRALPWPPSQLRAAPGARSAAGRCQRPPKQTRAAFSR